MLAGLAADQARHRAGAGRRQRFDRLRFVGPRARGVARQGARRARRWRNICGVCACHSDARSSVRSTRTAACTPSARFSVSATGTASSPPTASSSSSRTSRCSASRGTQGRAASCTRIQSSRFASRCEQRQRVADGAGARDAAAAQPRPRRNARRRSGRSPCRPAPAQRPSRRRGARRGDRASAQEAAHPPGPRTAWAARRRIATRRPPRER